jgi:hypothetical protein
MRKNIPLCEAARLCMVIALAVPGTAMSQEHSLLVDTGVIFSAQQLERSADAYRMLGITPPYWTPSFEDIARVERQLKPYLAGETNPQAKGIDTKPGSYKRQYLGYTNDGRRWIFVNSFCERWTKDRLWREDIIIVFDGGPCFFTVRYDQSNSQFDQLRINGPWRWP